MTKYSAIYSITDPRDLLAFPEHFHAQALENIENEKLDAPYMAEWFRAQGYIGKTTTTLRKRLGKHMCESRQVNVHRYKSRKNNWLRKLEREGIKPVIAAIIDCPGVTKDELNMLEVASIAFFRQNGGARLNTTVGGDGFDSESGKCASTIGLAMYTTEDRREFTRRANETLGVEGRRNRALKMNETLGVEGRHAKMMKVSETLGAEGLSKRSRRAMNTMGAEGRRQRSINSNAAMTPEQRTMRIKKANETLGEEGRRTAALKRVATLGPEGLKAKAKRLWDTRSAKKDLPRGISQHKTTKMFCVSAPRLEFGERRYLGSRYTLAEAIQLLEDYRTKVRTGEPVPPKAAKKTLPRGITQNSKSKKYNVNSTKNEFGESRYLGGRDTLEEAIALLEDYRAHFIAGEAWEPPLKEYIYPRGITWDKSKDMFQVTTTIAEFGVHEFVGRRKTLEEALQLLEDYRLQRRQSDVDPDNEE